MRQRPAAPGHRLLALVAGAALIIAGCGSTNTPAPSASAGTSATTASASPAAAASASTAPASQALFVIASTASIQKLDPQVVTNFLDFQALGLVYDTLVKYDNNLNVVASLAASWELSQDKLTLTFHLRDGVKFHDGSALTADDVVASMKRAQDPKTADASASFLTNVESITASGPSDVAFKLKTPDSSVLGGLTSLNLGIVSKGAIVDGSVVTKPDGTGPFEFVEWTPNQSFTVKANPNYWGGPVSLLTAKFVSIPDEQSISSALQAGTVQLGLLTQPQVVNAIPSPYQILKVLDLTYRALMLQSTSGPLANVNNRLALACAIDRQQILDAAAFGEGQIIGPVPLGPYASNPINSVCPIRDLNKAKAYLAAAGNPGGFKFTAKTSNELDPTDAIQAATAQAQLAEAGIKMDIVNEAGNAYIQDWLGGKFEGVFAWNGADPSPYTMYGRYFGKNPNLGVPAGYHSQTLQDDLEQGNLADPAAAPAAWAKLSKDLTTEAAWIWLFTGYNYAALAPNVKGFEITPTRDLSSLANTTVQ